ncbi:MAG TPA: YbhB/YbcL family Raf kinase inhibitor-like protein [Verrucomicrobiae bacterium]|nr:YbhB/YbcL family Raf kinase inhibitor-like protein [Verrucomicrobiae bacterium]
MNAANVRFFLTVGVAVAALGAMASDGKAAPAPFMVTSSSFKDGGMLTKKNAADDPMRMCGGENISPALALSNAPAKTKSFAIFMFDPDGRLGEGVSHWVGYGIPANVTSLAEGEIAKESKKFIGGKGTRDNALYIGPCPPAGDAPHHYVFTVVATDLEPGALKPGMTREQLYAALSGHGVVGASIIGKFAR